MLAVVAHDAGGAELLSSYIRSQGMNCMYVLEGPARKIFERKLGPVKLYSLEEAILKSDAVLCGTGWQSELEISAIQFAHSLGKRCIAFLDHWINYRERFVRAGKTSLPSEIWVGDGLAEMKAKEAFPNLPVHLVANPYFEDIRKELAVLKPAYISRTAELSVLYVCEPIREHSLREFGNAHHRGYIEEDALRYFLSHISALSIVLKCPIVKIVIRPHPAEPIGKYAWVCQEFSLPIVESGSLSLVEDLVGCDVVVGCESMAMVVGLLAGKTVISCIPPGGRQCRLPQRKILNLQMLVEHKGLI